MKKHIIKLYSCAMAVVMLFSACSDFLDITPDGQSKRDDQLSTAEGIEDAMYGCYASMRHTNLYGNTLSFNTLEILAQYFECEGNSTVAALLAYDYKNTSVKSIFEGVWTKMYNNISNVNSVLNCDLVKNAQEYPYTIYKGEALGLRAFMHFDLLRIFTEQITQNPKADGIPYATEFSLKTPEFVTAAKAYELILNDLLEAERLLADEKQYEGTTSFMTDRCIHFNLYAVKATLARVYLTMGEKEKAAQYALDVIKDSGKHLSSEIELAYDLAGVLSNNETIFGIYYSDFYSEVYPKLQQQTTRSSLDPRSDIMTYFQETDRRITPDYYFTDVSSSSQDVALRFSKLTDYYGLRNMTLPSGKIRGVNMIRLPEMYYIVAECYIAVNPEAAAQHFDEVLVSRGLQPVKNWAAPNNVLTVEAITAERYREFMGEGQAFFNMKRLNLPILSVDSKQTFQPSKDIFVVPVPDIEYDYRN